VAQSSSSENSYDIRQAKPEDASCALDFFRQVRAQSPYLLLESGEGIQDVEFQCRQFRRMRHEQDQVVYLAFHKSRPIGFVGVRRGCFRRNAHTASLAVAVDARYQRLGIGSLLMQAALAWAHAQTVRRVELTVATQNVGAIALYERHGFKAEGTKRKSFRIGDCLVDELVMACLFDA
jgi:RimJ/RimL family protein N-acetyltransferase